MLALFAALLLSPPQDLELAPAPPTPFDRVVELEITADDEPLIDGKGPTVLVEYDVEFSGTLHVWTESEFDLFLQVDDAAEARPLASDDNSGGGSTPYVELEVERGDWLMVLVAGEPDATGSLTVHLVATPETETGRAAERIARNALREATRLGNEGRQAEARELMARALPEVLKPVGSGRPDLVRARTNLADSMAGMGDLAGARALQESVLAGHERTLPVDHPNLLRARVNLVTSMAMMGDLSGARALLESVLAAYERTLPEDHLDLLRARGNLANLMAEIGDFAGALEVWESVLAGYERTLPEDHPFLLLARSNLAASMHRIDLAGAHALWESVLASYERTVPEGHPDFLRARANLALSMHGMGDLAGASALLESVLAAYERTLPEDHPSLLHARRSLATSMLQMGDLAGARALYASVLTASERTLPEGHRDLLGARVNLAISMQGMGDLASARALYESVLATTEHTLSEDQPLLLAAQANLAISMSGMGDLAGARALEESVLAGFERTLPEDHPILLATRTNLAVSMHRMGDLADARALRESLLAAFERTLPADHPNLLLARANLAVSMHRMGDLAGARTQLPKLIAGMRSRALASVALAPRQVRQTVASENARHSLALFLSGAELEEALFELTETMRLVVAEAARSLASFETDSELRPILDEAAEVRRALNDLVSGAAHEATGADDLSDEMTRLSLRRDRLEREAIRQLTARGVVMLPVGTETLTVALAEGDAAVGYRRIAHLASDEANGKIAVGEDHMFVHVLTSDGTLSRIDLGRASELEALAGSWRAALGVPLLPRGVGVVVRNGEHDDPELDAGRRLRARVLDPVLALVGKDVKRLLVCSDDSLFLLPLDALPFDVADAKDKNRQDPRAERSERIGDRLRIVNEVSFARLLAPATPAVATPSLLALGGVDYDARGAAPDGLTASSAPIEATEARGESSGEDAGEGDSVRSSPPDRFLVLPQARYEAEAAAALFEEAFELEPALLTRKSTTKAALFESAPGKRYLHLATHGWFAPESVRSTADPRPEGPGFVSMTLEDIVTGFAPMTLCGLALAGANNGRDSLGRVPGILTAEELCSLDLSQCDLAVLSACETNVGIRRAGQGIQSLQTALHAAGARTSITSLWRVDDAATRRLMELFYTKLWKEKLGKAEALWQAKKALRAEGHPPRDWAGWVLTGDPD